jgi:prepilin-type N-terminal cleavage/methylation domain-containing protein
MNKRLGFTLPETLACICIIAVLAGLLLPVYSSVRRRDAQSSVSNNLHSIGLAIAMYRSDDGGDGIYSDMYAMGLPPTLNQLSAYGIPAKIQFGPQGENEGWRAAGHVFYLPPTRRQISPINGLITFERIKKRLSLGHLSDSLTPAFL